jgi:hypothetical protein
MLASPTTITIDGTAHSLSRINSGEPYSSVYLKKATNLELRLTIRHSFESAKNGAVKVERHNADLIHTTWDANGIPTVTQTYGVFRTPQNVDPDRVADQQVGFNTWLTANVVALSNWES